MSSYSVQINTDTHPLYFKYNKTIINYDGISFERKYDKKELKFNKKCISKTNKKKFSIQDYINCLSNTSG